MELKSRVVPGVLVGGLVLAGGGSVVAISGGSSSHHSASQAEYCQPNSPGDNGNCNNNVGNGGNVGNVGNGGAKKHKKPHIHARRVPNKRCYSGKFRVRIRVLYTPKSRATRAYLHGKRIRRTVRKGFDLRIDTTNMRRGIHTLKITVRGFDGKLYKKRVRFRRC